MKESRYFIKQLTPAEVGDAKTHEKYIRLTNDFDYESFFPGMAVPNGTVTQVDFKAKDLTPGHEADSLISLKFVFYANSNKEKRIPSLGDIFDAHGVSANDVIALESRTEDGSTSFYITFMPAGTVDVKPGAVYYSIKDSEAKTARQAVLSCQDTKLSQFVYKVIADCHEYDTLRKLLSHTIRGNQTLEGKDFVCINIPEFNINRFFVVSDDDTVSQLSTTPKRLHAEAFNVGEENLYLTTQWADAESDTTHATFDKFANLINTVYAGVFSVRKTISEGIKLFQLFDLRGQSGQGNSEPGKNMIYYGSPGTGKSYQARKDTLGKAHVRTIFHPDSDYASFVGCYKPVMEDGKIVYKYRAQAFVNAYINAWLTDEPYYLVIEEINRGNCAQIFGDIFQLLDRTDGGSDYDVHPDTDLTNYISETFAKTENKMALDNKLSSVPSEIISGEVMRLPRNLHIIATMNTSDQSLFPMDSAFKRRWGWKFFSIKDGHKNYKIQITENGPLYDWWETIKALNEKIYATTKSADKQLGYWFAKVPEGQNIIDKETFVSKVVFYLWNDVFKDYGFGDNNAFTPETKFEAFYDDEGNVVESAVEAFIKRALNIVDAPIS